VLRVVEYEGTDVMARVEIDAQLIAGYSKCELLDLMERPTGESARLNGNVLEVPVRSRSFVTVKLS